jgi:hypothetical protein
MADPNAEAVDRCGAKRQETAAVASTPPPSRARRFAARCGANLTKSMKAHLLGSVLLKN